MLLELLLLFVEAAALLELPPPDLWLLDFLELLDLLELLLELELLVFVLLPVLVDGVLLLLEPFPGLSAANAVIDNDAAMTTASAAVKYFLIFHSSCPHAAWLNVVSLYQPLKGQYRNMVSPVLFPRSLP